MIFHKYQLIFVGIPKNGSTSVGETVAPGQNIRSHDTLKKLLDDNPGISNYCKAAIKRNPYIRAISAYTMMPGRCKTFKEKIKQVFDQHLSFVPTSLFVEQPNGSVVNYYYENKMLHINKVISTYKYHINLTILIFISVFAHFISCEGLNYR